MSNFDNFVEFGWEDEICDEGKAFVLLPEGDYDFTVKGYERARFAGSEKMPACNMAKVTFIINGAEDTIEITENYFLANKFEWKLSQLFLSVGLKKHGETLHMNWNALAGLSGKCHIYIDNFKRKDGSDGQSNKIKKLYAYDENVVTIKPNAQAQYTTPQTASNMPNANWKAGQF